MDVSRSSKRFVARLLLAALLFMQMAVAAYACPGLPSAMGSAVSVSEAAQMPADCAQMEQLDRATLNLCVAHCQDGQQSYDHQHGPSVPPAVLAVLYISLPDFGATASTGHTSACNTAATSPPHAILHCCFRI